MLEWSGRSRSVPPAVLKVKAPKVRAAVAELPETPRPEGPKALGALLCERGLLSDAQLQAAILRQQQTGRRLGHVLVELGLVTAEAVLEALSLQMGVPTVRINAFTVNTDAINALPEKVARRHTCLLYTSPSPRDS